MESIDTLLYINRVLISNHFGRILKYIYPFKLQCKLIRLSNKFQSNICLAQCEILLGFETLPKCGS